MPRKLTLFFIASCLLALQAQGQIGIPGIQDKSAKASSPVLTVEEQKDRIASNLAEIERQRKDSAASLPGLAQESGAEALEHKRLLDRLAVLHGERLKRLNDIAALENAPAAPLRVSPTVKALGDAPPYSAVEVDALRDELDGMRDRLKGLTSGLAVRETEKQVRQEELNKLLEGMRLANDRLAQAKNAATQEQARQRQELANLRKQVAEAELASIALDQDWTKLQTVRLKVQVDEMQDIVTRVLPQQRLSEADLEQLRERTDGQQKELQAEIDSITADNLRHVKELEKLQSKPAAESNKAALERKLLLDQILETDSSRLQGLKGLQLLLGASRDAWESRFIALNSADSANRGQAIATLKKFHAGLANRKRLVQEMREATRSAIREQENKIANLPQGADTLALEQNILVLMQKRAEIYERIETTANRLERQFARWLDDGSAQGGTAQVGDIRTTLKQWTAAAWNYEVFAVEDISEVDGRKVTVVYGVTVGKSIGALFLFILGYWAFSFFARKTEEFLVRRFGVDSQLARVIRRWVILSFAFVLVIFVLNLARIPLTVFAFMGGALAIGVGFGTQTIIKNFISGIIILFERKIRVGDIIESGGMTGQVTAVDLRATTVRGFDGIEALVPNSSFLENQVVNWTYTNQQIRREIKVGVAYGSDTRKVSELLLDIARNNLDVMNRPIPEVFFEDFGDSALMLTLVYWVELGLGKTARKIDSDLRHEIYAALTAAGIAIPFPQRDIHFSPAEALRVVVEHQ